MAVVFLATAPRRTRGREVSDSRMGVAGEH
jgi:hypothetical protein